MDTRAVNDRMSERSGRLSKYRGRNEIIEECALALDNSAWLADQKRTAKIAANVIRALKEKPCP